MTYPQNSVSDDVHGIARDELRQFIERVERLYEERRTLDDDVKEIYGEARGRGYDVKILKKVIALRRKDDQERMEEDLILDTYLVALGMKEAAQHEENEHV